LAGRSLGKSKFFDSGTCFLDFVLKCLTNRLKIHLK